VLGERHVRKVQGLDFTLLHHRFDLLPRQLEVLFVVRDLEARDAGQQRCHADIVEACARNSSYFWAPCANICYSNFP
jgi:hypothetical protein